MNDTSAAKRIAQWPEESREAAQLVIDRYGEPDEATPTQLVWHRRGERIRYRRPGRARALGRGPRARGRGRQGARMNDADAKDQAASRR